MTLTKRGSIAKKRKKKLNKLARGFTGSNSKLFKPLNQAVIHSLKYSYFDRKKKKKNFKNIWVRRINNESRNFFIPYNTFIFKLKKQQININKKILAEIIINDNETFKKIIKNIK